MGGTLFLRGDDDNTATFSTISYATNDVVVNGSATINVDRTGVNTSETTKLLQIRNLTIGAETLSIAGADTYKFGVSGTMTMTASPTLNLTADMAINGTVTDNGAGLSLIKQGTSTLWFNTNTSTFTGPVIVEQGAVRFGNTTTASTTSTAGLASSMILDPGASIQLQALTNINTGTGQKIDVRSGNFAGGLGIVQLNATFDPTSLLTSTSSGELLLTAAFATPLTLDSIGAGTFQLATTAATTYSGSLGAVGASGTWVVGGNSQNLTFTLANPNVFSGSGLLQVGSLLLGGGTVTMNTSNNYTGGTVVARGTSLAWSPTGAADTPLGTGPLDLFGTATVSGANGVFTQNTVVIHPGATVAISDATTSANRWGSGNAMALNGATLSYTGATAGSSQTIGNFSFAAGSHMTFAGTGIGTINVGTGAGTLTRAGDATLVFSTNNVGLLGTASAGGGRLIISGGGPTTANGMAGGYFVDGTSNTFVTYGANGFADAAYNVTNLPAGLVAGTGLAQINTASVTLADNPSIYALGFTSGVGDHE